MIEQILCSATRHGNHIISGGNHAKCLKIAYDAGFVKANHRMGQGFLTTKLRFVLRKEALSIAKRENQIKEKHYPFDKLLSEDLK